MTIVCTCSVPLPPFQANSICQPEPSVGLIHWCGTQKKVKESQLDFLNKSLPSCKVVPSLSLCLQALRPLRAQGSLEGNSTYVRAERGSGFALPGVILGGSGKPLVGSLVPYHALPTRQSSNFAQCWRVELGIKTLSLHNAFHKHICSIICLFVYLLRQGFSV